MHTVFMYHVILYMIKCKPYCHMLYKIQYTLLFKLQFCNVYNVQFGTMHNVQNMLYCVLQYKMLYNVKNVKPSTLYTMYALQCCYK